MGEAVNRINQLFPTLGQDQDRTILRFTPVADCTPECRIYDDCPYQKKGRCSLESQYLNIVARNIINPDPAKGIADQLNDFELQRIDHLMTLQHQRIRLLKLSYAIKHDILTRDKKGGVKVHPIFAEVRAVTKDIEALMKALQLDKKWERKFGKMGGPGLGPSVEELMEKGDPNYYSEISR